jgi:hypothetical protein
LNWVGAFSVYRNIFGQNLKPRRAEKSDLFRKLNAFGIGGETSKPAPYRSSPVA